MKIDKMNVRILNILQRDARKPVSEIARELRRAETTVRERIKLMETEKVIKGYCAVIDKKALGYSTEALVFCNIAPEKLNGAVEKLLTLKNVGGVYHINGERRVVINVAAKINEEVWKFVHYTLIPLGFVDIDSRVIMKKEVKMPPEGLIESEFDL